jgi:hypothetical protein
MELSHITCKVHAHPRHRTPTAVLPVAAVPCAPQSPTGWPPRSCPRRDPNDYGDGLRRIQRLADQLQRRGPADSDSASTAPKRPRLACPPNGGGAISYKELSYETQLWARA